MFLRILLPILRRFNSSFYLFLCPYGRGDAYLSCPVGCLHENLDPGKLSIVFLKLAVVSKISASSYQWCRALQYIAEEHAKQWITVEHVEHFLITSLSSHILPKILCRTLRSYRTAHISQKQPYRGAYFCGRRPFCLLNFCGHDVFPDSCVAFITGTFPGANSLSTTYCALNRQMLERKGQENTNVYYQWNASVCTMG